MKKILSNEEIMVALLSGYGLGDDESFVRLDECASFLRVTNGEENEAFPSELIFENTWNTIYYGEDKEFSDCLSPKEFMLHIGGGGKAIKEDWDDRYLAFDEEGNLNIYSLDGDILEGLFVDRLISLGDWYRFKIDAGRIPR